MEKLMNIHRLVDSGLVAVIRRPKAEQIAFIAEALVNGGVGALEITVETPGVFRMIEQIKQEFGQQVLVGAGTVLDAETAKTAIEAGSDFIFSPIVDEKTIEMTNSYGKISIPGAMTPTEIVKAYQAGADILKIFPGNSLGPNYLKELKGPLGHIPMMPTGGVSLDNVEQFVRNGAVAVGVGGTLLNKQAIAEGRYEVLTDIASKFTASIKRARLEEQKNKRPYLGDAGKHSNPTVIK
ncbi:bifunctional 4-hydroxy-2-oxoglutarate aldolase/2-dehydro-3-deoxy-phosphogluconate aldolase [Bacillus sp. FJAT-29790]|uniref:bifunctional 4-hydroxy-2-oxoglutarate aldolase/2-dehydro-3-deoxy-phosphogluconate aldolase n=1 Tax=Bacillus sp. FJAT-29790 TaxID=1895002 RepID=UPI001C2422FB|nr:bifunctional 4-hydroxy-2-oxoglutarate aldolase/2-dehydro-3-deoxy-phosphogluconate aldolase [Bacillus sp. FJAT-29790]MBU8879889.1 bifunctional 4-hydroxy-2-oxoglutarate aldolase/2-dehydro-3-deoxy-phosphogluconate aldolase [Bacillus sp. FJAT-29790]